MASLLARDRSNTRGACLTSAWSGRVHDSRKRSAYSRAAPLLRRDSLGSVVSDDDLRRSDRVLRAVLGAIVGAGVGLMLMLQSYERPTTGSGRALDAWLVPVLIVAAGVGAVLGSRSRR